MAAALAGAGSCLDSIGLQPLSCLSGFARPGGERPANRTLRQRSSTGGNGVCRQCLLNAIIADPSLSANKKINVIYILTETLGRS